MLSRTPKTVASITATMTKMAAQLQALAEERETLASKELAEARRLEDAAQANYDEAVKARGVATKIGELVA